ncbi:MAG: glycosyltransferase family 2 protein [Patescibacteria group bacterium]|nr:glycosyltransferase family 2 protein [Patescibacteria group bacterium]MDD4304547.1 glycosyltransferase family 2 protein [Patescibacteria group bacterium]MDD4695655.1 glycosyltransferase family 2 protein [Patescibacteria group bacterium]
MKLIIFLPVYNEEANILSVLERIPKNIPNIDILEVLAIEDGSCDSSLNILKQHNVSIISHIQNMGLSISFQDALEYAINNSADILLSIDSDNQFDPQEIEKVIKPILEKKSDIVLGNRFKNGKPKNMPTIKFFGNIIMSKIINFITGYKFQDVSCGFRAYSKDALLNLNLFGKFTYTHETILDLCVKNKQFLEVPISVQYFDNRKSHISSNLFKYAIKTILIMINSLISYRPLFLFGGIGFVLFLFGLIPDIFILVYYINYGQLSPYKIYAFVGGFLNILGILFIIIGLALQSLKVIRMNQEKILYNQKKFK